MIDRDIILRILGEHFPTAPYKDLEKAADALLNAFQEQWEPVNLKDEEMGYTISNELIDVCLIDRLLNEGYEIRIFRSKKPVHEKGVLDRKYLEYLNR